MIKNKVQQKARMIASLSDIIDNWLAEYIDANDIERFGYVGDNTDALMAEAAIAVFFAVDDVQEYLVSDGQLEP